MKKDKMFFNQVNFYLMVCAFALVVVALSLYAGNCASEFNGNKVSPNVVVGDIIAIIFIAIAVASSVIEFFMPDKPVLLEVVKYKRFCLYIAFFAMVYSLFMSILAEYSLIGTILYPIVSGTVGDPVDSVLSTSYFAQLICAFLALVCSLTSAIMQKSFHYKTEKAAKCESTKAERIGGQHENI